MVDIPHFDYPFRFENGAAVVLEQDSKDEIVACATAIILCPTGFRVELPEFGVTDPTFTQNAPDTAAIEVALTTWEPRAHSIVTSTPDALDVFVANVTARVGAPSQD